MDESGVSLEPSAAASTEPSAGISGEPSASISAEPSAAVTGEPSRAISGELSAAISGEPSAAISVEPSAAISADPSAAISAEPSAAVSSDLAAAETFQRSSAVIIQPSSMSPELSTALTIEPSRVLSRERSITMEPPRVSNASILASTSAVRSSSVIIAEEGKRPKRTRGSAPVDHIYHIKPSLEEKFKETPVKEIIRNVVSSTLTGKIYEPDAVKKWTIHMANEINERVKELQLKRYKHVVQVILGEMKGAGVKSGVRCLWDSDIDSYTSEIFMNDTIFCVTTVFAVYLY